MPGKANPNYISNSIMKVKKCHVLRMSFCKSNTVLPDFGTWQWYAKILCLFSELDQAIKTYTNTCIATYEKYVSTG